MMTSGHSLDSLSDFLDKARHRYKVDTPTWPKVAETAQQAAPIEEDNPPLTHSEQRESAPELDEAWEKVQRIFHEGTIVKGIVTGWNRGGLLVRWDALQGFVPASQIKEMPIFEAEDSRDEKLSRWVGEELQLKVIELDRNRNRLVFSERATIWGPKDGDQLLDEIVEGETRQGYVSNLCDFGAFVDLGGIDGLIHISELSWGRVSHPRDFLDIGEEINVHVLGVDRDNRRVALSLKRLHPDPWTVVDGRYYPGQTTQATITNIVDFGAFARIEEGLEGLIHISELPEGSYGHPGEVVNVGEQVEVRILRIDSANHRLGLSMRDIQTQDQAEPPAMSDASVAENEWGSSQTSLFY